MRSLPCAKRATTQSKVCPERSRRGSLAGRDCRCCLREFSRRTRSSGGDSFRSSRHFRRVWGPSAARLLRVREAVASLWMTAAWSKSTKCPGGWNRGITGPGRRLCCSVILSEVVGREASDNAVEGPFARLHSRWRVREFSRVVGSSGGNSFRSFAAPHAGMGSFDCATASHSRSSRFAQDDRGEYVNRTPRAMGPWNPMFPKGAKHGAPLFVERDENRGPPATRPSCTCCLYCLPPRRFFHLATLLEEQFPDFQ